jgi:AcrR family transcriptional regulator
LGLVSRPYGANREAILNAAETLIRERGVGAMSVADIIAASGTSAGAIYHHFEAKQDIVLAIAERALSRPIEAAIQETGPVTPAELFRLAARRVAAEAETAPLLLQVWAGAAADERLRDLLRDRAGGLPVGVAAHVEEWCVTHGHEADSVAVASLLVGLVMGLVIQSSLFDDFNADDYVTLAVEGLSRLGQG